MAVDYGSLDPDMRLCVTLLCSLRYTPSSRTREARAAALARWRAKRQRRRRATRALQEGSLIRYGVRKKLAESRPRVKGRFLKKKDRKAQGKAQSKPKSEPAPSQKPETENADRGKEVGDSLRSEEERAEKEKDARRNGPDRHLEKFNADKVQDCNREDSQSELRKEQLQVAGICAEKNLVAESEVVAVA